MTEPFISICIASRQEGPEVRATVEDVLASAAGPIEVIVCDDASTDGSCDGLDKLENVTLLQNDKPRGAGWSMNRAMQAAKGDVLFKIDAHMRFERGMLHGLARYALEHNCIVCGTVKGLGEGKLRGGAVIHFADWAFRDHEIGLNWRPPPEGDRPERRLALMGACYGFPRKIWNLMGEYPSTAGIWGAEEQAISAWAWLHDVPIYVVPGWEAQHLYRYKQPIPWGGPPISDRSLNILVNMLRLFDWETYKGVWRDPSLHLLAPEHQMALKLYEADEQVKPHVWKRGRKKTDAEFFRDVMHMPAIVTNRGAVKRLRPISVIVAARNEGPEVLKTVCSFINQGQSRFEIIVVDDASTDGSIPPDFPDQVKKHVKSWWREDIHKRIKVIRHDVPQGSSRSRAEAIRIARGEIISVWDGHQRMNTWLGIEKLATTAQERGGIVVPAVRNLGNPIDGKHTCGARFQLKGEPWGILNKHLEKRPEEMPPHDSDFENHDAIERRVAVIGCGYTLTRETLEALGGWPELPGVWAYQEQWLGFRAYFLGIPCWVRCDVRTEHKFKKEFNYRCTRQDSHGNGHYVIAIHFPETYEGFWRARLPKDVFVPDYRAERERWLRFPRIKTEQDFFRECLEIDEWPPPVAV